MAETLRVLLVGAGYFGRLHRDAWLSDGRVHLAGIVDTDLERARDAAARTPGARAFASLEAGIDAVGPDVVDIVTPPASHLDLLRVTMARGIATVCQKPFCGGLERALDAVALARDAGTTLVVHENFRFQPWYRAIRRLLEERALGDLHQATFRLRPGDGQGPSAYLDRQPYFRRMKRFLVQETGVHLVDTFRYLMGEPDWVWADLRRLNPAIAGEDAGLVVLGYADGRRAVLDADRLVDHAAADARRTMGEARVEGSKAVVDLLGSGALTLRPHGSREAHAVEIGRTDETFGGGCVARLQAHVADHLLDGTALENEAGEYVRNLRIVEAIYRSAGSGARVALDGP